MALTLLSACDRNPPPAPPAQPAAKATSVTTTQPQLPDVAPLVKTEPEPPVPDLYLRKLRPPLADVVKLAQSGTAVDVIRAYIIVSTNSYDLSDAEIAYLGDLGLAPEIILEMLVKDGKRPLPTAASPQAPAPPAAPETPPLPAPTSAEYQVFYTTTPASVPVETSYAPVVEELPPIVYYDPPPAGYAETVVVHFESELADYGTWLEVPDYGRCWRPNAVAVNPNWRPYCDGGRWVYSECGWYWQSDYTWGWAAFHYGRWHRHARHGWLWQPGRLWAPAWVSWRVSAQFFGWAPLPPGAKYKPGAGFLFQGQTVGANFEFGLTPDQYTFVPAARVKDPNWMAFALRREEAWQIARETAVSNHYRTKNHRIVNLGKDFTQPAANTRAQEVQVLIRDLPPTPPVPPERITRHGNNWVIYRKLLPSEAQTSHASPQPTASAKPVTKTRPVEPQPLNTTAAAEQRRNETVRMLAEEQAAAQRAQAEARRLTEERARAEAQAQAQALAQAEETARQQLEARRQAEAQRQAEARTAAERARFEETVRLRAEEERRAEMARRAEAERLAAEQAAERARAEEHARRRAEEEQQAEEARRVEARRLAEERARSEELARQRAEAQRQAEAARQAEARRQAEERAKAEEHARRQEAERQAEAARQAEARRVAEAQAAAERARADEARRQAEERSRREAEERSKRDSDEKNKDKK